MTSPSEPAGAASPLVEGGVAGPYWRRGARPDATTISACRTQLRRVSGCMPSCSATRAIAPCFVAGSARSSTAIRVARSRNSSGYFLGAATTLILPWNESLHQTRHATR